jgi:release factor glutamine methyltransferase
MEQILILEIQRQLPYPRTLSLAKEIAEFTQGNNAKIKKILKRLHSQEPWEYIRGYTHFLNSKILLNNNVLIPRIETEELVSIATKAIKKLKGDFQIFDIGTGSACIAIALSKISQKQIYAIDIDKQALKIAEKNMTLNNCNNIKIINADLLNFEFDTQKPTVIIANLPYIPSKKIKELDNSVKYFEPNRALDGGPNGAVYYKKLLEQIKQKNVNVKYMVFEIDESITKEFKNMNAKILKDSFNKQRFLVIHPSHLKQQ